MSRSIISALLVLATLVSGCGKDVEDVCKDLVDSCSDVIRNECLDDGANLQKSAEEHGCDQPFSVYLDCVAGASCAWAAECASQRAGLEACLGAPFPN